MAADRAPTDDEVLERWDAFADLYEKHFFTWSEPALHSAISALGLQSVDAPNCSILDVGCGPGQDIAAIRAHASQSKVIAVDFSPEMITKAGARAVQSAADVRVDDAQTLATIESESVDRLISNLCIHLIPDAEKAITSFYRVLKPGGLMCASVWGTQGASPQFTLQGAAIKSCVESGALPPELAAPKSVRNNFHLGSDDLALRKRFSSAGFECVLSWHVQCVWPAGGTGPGKTFAESWLASQVDNVKLMEKLDEAQRASLVTELTRQADNLLADGQAIGCDVVLVSARKPFSSL